MVPIRIHNLSKSFRPNLATIWVLSLGMKFIPKTQSTMWKNMFSNFKDFKQRMNNIMFSLLKKLPELVFNIKLVSFKVRGVAWRNTKTSTNVNDFCYNIRDRLNGVTKRKRHWNFWNKTEMSMLLLMTPTQILALLALIRKMSKRKVKDNFKKKGIYPTYSRRSWPADSSN